MKTLGADSIYTEGALLERAWRNFDRLETDLYDTKGVFQTGAYSWPGDWEGRALLGLVLLSKTTRRTPRFLYEILNKLPAHLNGNNYFGKIMEKGEVDEQQLAGNSWFLRSMCEYYEWTGDAFAYKVIKDIAEKLIIPTKDFYHIYPLSPDQRNKDGQAMGELVKDTRNGWHLSTDTGCAFIMLDGATHALKILKDQALKETIEAMIEKFLTADVYALQFQTHATLSATRGLLRFYEVTGDKDVLKSAQKIFSIYTDNAMTENFANYNWFQRPEWTEPCAHIDSYIAAMELFRFTSETSYLEIAQKIYFNALGFGQRNNGGFGVDSCSGIKNEFLKPKNEKLYEAYWCCTMRGGEGLSRAIGYQYLCDDDGTLLVTGYNSNTVTFETGGGSVTLHQSSRYPEEGYVLFEVLNSTAQSAQMKLFIPSFVERDKLSLKISGKPVETKLNGSFMMVEFDPSTDKVIELSFEIPLLTVKTSKNHISANKYMHGFVLLGAFGQSVGLGTLDSLKSAGHAMYKNDEGLTLKPVYEAFRLSKEELLETKIQILF
ncbi:MAG: glycoside hydrolase family 127 protein [Bacillota bacterium]|nr:glycoside hydrolase family 127 protein [Bacillota bacterium]